MQCCTGITCIIHCVIVWVLRQINLQAPFNMRISYTDYKLYLSIFEAVSRQLNKAIKMEVKATEKEELPEHSFDGENVN